MPFENFLNLFTPMKQNDVRIYIDKYCKFLMADSGNFGRFITNITNEVQGK